MYSKLIIFLFVLIPISVIKGDDDLKTSNETLSVKNNANEITRQVEDLSKQESKQTIKQISIKNSNQQTNQEQNQNKNTLRQRTQIDKTAVDKTDKLYQEKGKIKLGLAKSNFGIRVSFNYFKC